MRPDFRERHFDYVLGPSQDSRLASVAAGAKLSLELHMDMDAPFLLRGRAMRVSYDNLDSKTQIGIQNVALRYSGPDQQFFMQGLIPQNLQMPYGGQGGAWKPVYPQVLYPVGSVMQIVIQNTGAVALANLTLYWRGVKLFPWGSNPYYNYPAKAKAIPFVYPIAPITAASPYGMITNLLTAETRNSQIFTCLNDADFVFRYGQAGPSFAPFGLEVFITLKDENEKAYSSAPVHVEVLFGPSIGNYTTGGSSIPAIGTGDPVPPTMFPEIYVQANHKLYYDIVRADSGFAGAATIPFYPVSLIGSKVYPL